MLWAPKDFFQLLHSKFPAKRRRKWRNLRSSRSVQSEPAAQHPEQAPTTRALAGN
jgi:hypothetical protein